MKRKKSSEELNRTARKIQVHATKPVLDSLARILSATSTQANIALSLEALEAQPSQAGKHRKGHRGPFRHAIEKICLRLDPNKRDLKSVLTALENEDYIDDLYGAAEDPIDIHAIEIDREDQKVYYDLRNGESDKKSFKTIYNLISIYKSSLPE